MISLKFILESPVYSNIYHLLRGQFLQYLLAFLTNILFVREQSVENVGAYNYILSFTSVFGVLTGIWLKDIFIREIKSNPNQVKKILGSAFLISALFCLISSLLSVIIIFILNGYGLYFNLTLIIVPQFLLAPFNIFSFYFDSDLKSKFIVNSIFFSSILVSILKIFFIYNSSNPLLFMAINTFGYLIIAAGYIYIFLKKYFKFSDLTFDVKITKKLFYDSYPLIFSNIFVILIFKIDQIIVGQYSKPLDNAIYSSSMKLVEIWYFLPMVVFTSYYPSVINAIKESRNLFLLKIEQVTVIMVRIFLAVAVPILLISPFVGGILYGSNYSEISNLIPIQIFLFLFVCLNTVRNAYFFAMNLTRQITYINLFTLLTTYFICSNLFFSFGIVGISYGMVISYLLGTLFATYIFRDSRDMFYVMLSVLSNPFKQRGYNG